MKPSDGHTRHERPAPVGSHPNAEPTLRERDKAELRRVIAAMTDRAERAEAERDEFAAEFKRCWRVLAEHNAPTGWSTSDRVRDLWARTTRAESDLADAHATIRTLRRLNGEQEAVEGEPTLPWALDRVAESSGRLSRAARETPPVRQQRDESEQQAPDREAVLDAVERWMPPGAVTPRVRAIDVVDELTERGWLRVADRPADWPPYCMRCGREFAASACGPSHALIAHERGVAAHDERSE